MKYYSMKNNSLKKDSLNQISFSMYIKLTRSDESFALLMSTGAHK